MIDANVKEIDPRGPRRWYVIFTISGHRLYLLQTLRGTSRDEAAQNNIIGRRVIEPVPDMDEPALATEILSRKEFWSFPADFAEMLIGKTRVTASPIVFLRVVAGIGSHEDGTVVIDDGIYLMGEAARTGEPIPQYSTPVRLIVAGEPRG